MADQEEVKRICDEIEVSREEALYYLEGFNWDIASAMEACRQPRLNPRRRFQLTRNPRQQSLATPVATYPPRISNQNPHKDLSPEVKKERIDAFRRVAYGNGMTLYEVINFLSRFNWNVVVAVNHFLDQRNLQYMAEDRSTINLSNLHRKDYIR